ncbi:IS5 family transposase (plasmid) [Skermanella sp. TT6]|uniref:IS5 family transposase n=1 Tax=Skermanella cutis TaxID=2775420 RepID=A0ABX7BFY2_9PROT|nr:IS5 family transposase [Skermanella sp. TT6]QQP92675.1 IS5 family transposase [Skermanella sp. TT6]
MPHKANAARRHHIPRPKRRVTNWVVYNEALRRRARTLELPAQTRATGGAIHLLVDSSGLKLGGPGEWLVEKHGTSKRRSWRKLHIGFDAVTGRIVASILTYRDVDDASQVEPLLDQIAEPMELFLADGGYDRTGVYTALEERHPDAKVIVPPRADAVLSATAETEPTQRDGHIQAIADKGRMAWQRDSGYNQRVGVEGQFARWKQVIGDGLRFHSDQVRATKVAVAARVLNRMLDLGRRDSVRVA